MTFSYKFSSEATKPGFSEAYQIPFLAPYFVEIQRKSFLHFLQTGLIYELSKRNFFSIPNKKWYLIFYPEYYQLSVPEYTPKQAILKKKTYGSKLYVPLQVTNYRTKQFQLQWVNIGNIPLMTKRGHFIVNGSPRVIVNQLVRSPGIYYREAIDKQKNKTYYADLISNRGAWLRIEIDKKKRIWIRMKKARKVPILIFLKALGISDLTIKRSIKYPEFLEISKLKTEEIETEDYYHPPTIEDSILRLYSLAYPFKKSKADPSIKIPNVPILEKAQKLFFRKFFSHRTYDLSDVGRAQLNKKFQIEVLLNTYVLTPQDLLCATDYLIKLDYGIGIVDDIDHLKNRRVRASGELIQNQIGTGCIRLAKFIREKSENKKLSIPTLISTKPLNGALREFFGSSPLSQFMDQTNPLAELTHKRRVTSLGPGGINRETATMAVRGIHPTYYGRICPIETPEGRNAGLVNSLTVFSRINNKGFIETPFYSVYQGQVQKYNGVSYLSAAQEENITIAPGDVKTNYFNFLPSTTIPVRADSQFKKLPTNQIAYISISPLQMISIATSLIPFLEHDDANRALMGSNMQRQAVPLLLPEKPIVGTGLEGRIVSDSGHGIQAKKSGFVSYVSNESIKVTNFFSSAADLRLVPSFDSVVSVALLPCFARQRLKKQNFFISKKQRKKQGKDFSKTLFFDKIKKLKAKVKVTKLERFNNSGVVETFPSKKTRKFVINKHKNSYLLSPLFHSESYQNTKFALSKQSFHGRAKYISDLTKKYVVPRCKKIKNIKKTSQYGPYENIKKQKKAVYTNFLHISELLSQTKVIYNNKILNFNKFKNNGIFSDRIKKLNERALEKPSFMETNVSTFNLKTNYIKINTNSQLSQTLYKVNRSLLKREQYISKIHFLTFSKINKDNFITKEELKRPKNTRKSNLNTSHKPSFTTDKLNLENLVIEFSKLIFTQTFIQKKNLKHIFFSTSFSWGMLETSTFNKIESGTKIYNFFLNYPYVRSNSSILNNFFNTETLLSADSNKSDSVNFFRSYKFCYQSTKPGFYASKNPGLTGTNLPLLNLEAFKIRLKATKNLFQIENKIRLRKKIFANHLYFETCKVQILNSSFLSEFNFLHKNIEYYLQPYQHSNQNTCIHQRPIVQEGDWVEKGDLVADGAASIGGELSLGKTILVAYMPWEGYNFEDAILISQRLIYDDLYTSIHIERYEVEISDTQHGIEQITSILPDVPDSKINSLDHQGIIKLGTWVNQGDILVGKVTPIKAKKLSGHEKLVAAVLGKTLVSTKRDTSLRVPKNVSGRVVHIEILETENIPKGVSFCGPGKVHIYIAEKRKIQVGDKMSGRHGNKGIVSKIVPRQDMPYLPDGTPIDMVLNPLGVPSRMNVGQIFECLLGLAGKELHEQYKIRCFDEMNGPESSRSLTYSKLFQARLKTDKKWLFNPNNPGKIKLFDGRTGECFHQTVTVGQSYILKLVHLVDEKIHARSTGPYSLVTQQPLRGKSKHGGQRVGEMEVWALEGFGAAYILQEILTTKSDDIQGRHQVMQAIFENKSITLGTPESFKVLVSELQSLCLHIGVYSITNSGARTKIDSMRLS